VIDPSFVPKQDTLVVVVVKSTLARTVVPKVNVLFAETGSFPSNATSATNETEPAAVADGTVYVTVTVDEAPEANAPSEQLIVEPPVQTPVDGEIVPCVKAAGQFADRLVASEATGPLLDTMMV